MKHIILEDLDDYMLKRIQNDGLHLGAVCTYAPHEIVIGSFNRDGSFEDYETSLDRLKQSEVTIDSLTLVVNDGDIIYSPDTQTDTVVHDMRTNKAYPCIRYECTEVPVV